jgi:16S rRNA (cytidine1402-2'-O)-methyltransferase
VQSPRELASADRAGALIPLWNPERMGLCFVPTPLGNLRDMTLRALDVLGSCDLIVSEDTRVTRRLLSAHSLGGKEIWTYTEHSPPRSVEAIVERARTSLVAVVSDAGTPGISDPGRALVVAARAAGVSIEVLPGPSAFVCAAVLSGFDLRGFSFEGFVPRAAGEREAALRAALLTGRTSVWYESPQRILTTLEALARLAPECDLVLVRELSKLHEQQLAGSPERVAAGLERPVRGEIAFVLHPRPAAAAAPPAEGTVDAAIEAALAAGRSTAAAAKELAAAGLGERAALYARISARKRGGGGGT